jgi:hypothetical protein
MARIRILSRHDEIGASDMLTFCSFADDLYQVRDAGSPHIAGMFGTSLTAIIDHVEAGNSQCCVAQFSAHLSLPGDPRFSSWAEMRGKRSDSFNSKQTRWRICVAVRNKEDVLRTIDRYTFGARIQAQEALLEGLCTQV